MKKRRKLIALNVLLVLAFIGAWLLIKKDNTPVINAGMSQRSKEYFDMVRRENGSWQQVQMNSSAQPVMNSKNIKVGTCLTVSIPFILERVREQGECNNDFFTKEPKGHVIVYAVPSQNPTLDDDPGVKLRRQAESGYTENKLTINGNVYTVFKNTNDSYQSTALLQKDGMMYVFSFNIPTNDNLDEQFKKLLTSVVYD